MRACKPNGIPEARRRLDASGRSTLGLDIGSYSCFCSSANMLLLLTREALLSRSTLALLDMTGDSSYGSWFSRPRVGDRESRLCQYRCGESFWLRGENLEENGDVSNVELSSSCFFAVSVLLLIVNTRLVVHTWIV